MSQIAKYRKENPHTFGNVPEVQKMINDTLAKFNQEPAAK
jgi:hypothetical protein